MKKLAFAVLLTSVSAYSLSLSPAFSEENAPDAEKEAVQAEPKKKAKPAKDFTIIKFNGQDIKNSEVEDIWSGLFPGGGAPDFDTFDESIRQNVLRGIISERLIYDQAAKENYDKNPEVLKKLENIRKQIVMQSYLENKSKAMVTDQQLRAAYAEKVAAMKDAEEIHARHILVPTEKDAKDILAEVKKGGDFEAIAREKSTDKGSGAQGGDLGYFTKDRMIPAFAEAAFKLKKGDISEPVKTTFGWHVIKIEDRRKAKPPAFEDMKESLKTEMTNKALQEYVEGLLKTADITYYGSDGRKREFSKSLAPAAGEKAADDGEEKQ